MLYILYYYYPYEISEELSLYHQRFLGLCVISASLADDSNLAPQQLTLHSSVLYWLLCFHCFIL